MRFSNQPDIGDIKMTDRDFTGNNKAVQAKKKHGGHKKIFTTEQFVAKAKEKHKNYYCYNKANYLHSRVRLVITCPEHGDFEQAATNHLRGDGCRKCAAAAISKAKTKDINHFISTASKKHYNKYDYSKSVYLGSTKLITINCPEHGDFKRTAASHLAGYGCNTCAGIFEHNTERFVERAKTVHGDDKYNYCQSVYKSAHEKVNIICSEHGAFWQSATEHLKGSGCGACASELVSGYSRSDFIRLCNEKNGNAILYAIKCYNDCESFYKIGITSNDLQKRFQNRRAMPYSFEELYLIEGKAGYIYDLEVRLHSLLKSWSYKPSVRFRGYTECFSTIKPVDKLLMQLSSDNQIQLIA